MPVIDEWSDLASLLANLIEKYGPAVLDELDNTSEENKTHIDDS